MYNYNLIKDVYNKSYYICNEVMMGLSIFSNYIRIADIIGLIKKQPLKIMILFKCNSYTSHNEKI